MSDFNRVSGPTREVGDGVGVADRKLISILERGVDSWNRWRRENPLAHVVLREADLGGADLRRANFAAADLSRAFLSGADLSAADLTGADLSGADLSGVDQVGANLRGANLHSADLTAADLSRAEATGANLSRARLVRVNARGAVFADADLGGADFSWADLSGACLVGAGLRGALLTAAGLGQTDLAGADLVHANLSDADLRGAKVDRIRLRGTVFGNTNLAGARGLAGAVHEGPSIVDHGTLERSGPLPPEFLRGCGLPDPWIEHLPRLLDHPGFAGGFLIYARDDKSFAVRLHDALQGRGVRCWLDERRTRPADGPPDCLEQRIGLKDKLVVCCSQRSLGSSWMGRVVDHGVARERTLWRERGLRAGAMVAIDLDGSLPGWDDRRSGELESRLVADFSGWEEDDGLFDARLADVVAALRRDAS